MGLLGFCLAFMRPPQRRPAAPFPQTREIDKQINASTFVVNNPAARVPFPQERDAYYYLDSTGKHQFTQGDPAVIRVPRQESQLYFDEKVPLPPRNVFVYAHAVQTPHPQHYYGWRQAFVPLGGRRDSETGTAPAPLLTHAIKETTVVQTSNRAPISGAKAPKPKRGHNS